MGCQLLISLHFHVGSMLCSTSSNEHVSSQQQQQPKHLLFLSFPFQFEIFSPQVLPLFSSSSSSFFIQCRHGFLLRLICVFVFVQRLVVFGLLRELIPIHWKPSKPRVFVCLTLILTFLLVRLTTEALVFPKSFMAALLLYVVFFFLPLQSLSLGDSRLIENKWNFSRYIYV